jgi:hypothetical protein
MYKLINSIKNSGAIPIPDLKIYYYKDIETKTA